MIGLNYNYDLLYDLENVNIRNNFRGIQIQTDKYEILYVAQDKTCFVYEQMSYHRKMIRQLVDNIDADIFGMMLAQNPTAFKSTSIIAPYAGDLLRIPFNTTNEFLDYFVQHDNIHIKYANAFDINVKIENLLLL